MVYIFICCFICRKSGEILSFKNIPTFAGGYFKKPFDHEEKGPVDQNITKSEIMNKIKTNPVPRNQSFLTSFFISESKKYDILLFSFIRLFQLLLVLFWISKNKIITVYKKIIRSSPSGFEFWNGNILWWVIAPIKCRDYLIIKLTRIHVADLSPEKNFAFVALLKKSGGYRYLEFFCKMTPRFYVASECGDPPIFRQNEIFFTPMQHCRSGVIR